MKIKLPKPATAMSMLSKEEVRAWKEREGQRFVLRLREAAKDARAALLNDLGAGYVLSPNRAKALAFAEAKAQISHRFFGKEEEVTALDLESLIGGLRAMGDHCLDVTLRSADGAESCGDMNSTCAFTRAFGAAALSAVASLYREVQPIINYLLKE